MLKNKKIVITGGAGFIGSTIASTLIEDNELVIIDSFMRKSSSNLINKGHQNLKLIEGDILDSELLIDAFKGVNFIIHCAAIAGIDAVIENPTGTMITNMIGTANVLNAAQMNSKDLELLIEFSTSEVFGSDAFGVDENRFSQVGQVGEARWTYSVSKLAGEHLSKAYNTQFKLPTVTIRPFNVYGPGQFVAGGAMNKFIINALKGEDLEIYGDGNQIRAWCYIDDFVSSINLVLSSKRSVGESFNIGNPRQVITIYGLAQTILRVLDSRSKIVFKEALSADVALRVPNTIKSKELLGFEAKVDLEEGIIKTSRYLKELLNI